MKNFRKAALWGAFIVVVKLIINLAIGLPAPWLWIIPVITGALVGLVVWAVLEDVPSRH